MSINLKKINTSLSVRSRNQNIHFINKKTNDFFLLTITATKTVKPNANDIIVWSPNVHAAHAKKFNKNIPGKKERCRQKKIAWKNCVNQFIICKLQRMIIENTGWFIHYFVVLTLLFFINLPTNSANNAFVSLCFFDDSSLIPSV